MARPITARFGKMIVGIATIAQPTVFNAPCGLTSKSITFASTFGEVNIPDCDDPDAMNWMGRDKQSLSCAISGEGVMAAEAIQTYWEFMKDAESRMVEVSIEFSTGTMVWIGPMHLENFAPSAEVGGRVQVSLAMQSDGEMVGTWTPKAGG